MGRDNPYIKMMFKALGVRLDDVAEGYAAQEENDPNSLSTLRAMRLFEIIVAERSPTYLSLLLSSCFGSLSSPS